MGLVGRSVRIDHKVELRLQDLEVAKQDARTEEPKNAHPRVQMLDLCVGGLEAVFQAVNYQPVCFRFQIEKPPAE